MKMVIVLTALIGIFSSSCYESETTSDTSSTNNSVTIVKGDTNSNSKSDVDIYIEGGKAAVELTKEIIENKQQKDSVRNENKDRVWVYQIGTPLDDEQLAGEAYDKLRSIRHLYIFKKGRKEFYLIKDDGYSSKEQLTDSLGSFKKLISTLTSNRVEIVDLSRECSSRKQPTISSSIKYKVKGEKREAECRICK